MKDNSGETTATMRLGITAAENATAEELYQLAKGERNIIEIISDINKREDAAQQEVGSTFSLRETGEEITKGIPLYEGYTINALKHGEISDLAAKIGEYYKKTGKNTLNIEPVGTVLLDANGASNSIGHFMKNRRSTEEHKQMVTNAFELVPDILGRCILVEYGTQTDNPLLSSYLFVAPVSIEGKRCIMAVRVRRQVGQNGRFYLHGVELLETLTTLKLLRQQHLSPPKTPMIFLA